MKFKELKKYSLIQTEGSRLDLLQEAEGQALELLFSLAALIDEHDDPVSVVRRQLDVIPVVLIPNRAKGRLDLAVPLHVHAAAIGGLSGLEVGQVIEVALAQYCPVLQGQHDLIIFNWRGAHIAGTWDLGSHGLRQRNRSLVLSLPKVGIRDRLAPGPRDVVSEAGVS